MRKCNSQFLQGIVKFWTKVRNTFYKTSAKIPLEEMHDTVDEQLYPLILGNKRIYQTENCWERLNPLHYSS